MASFVNQRNVIMVNDNTGADNRHRYEKAAAAQIYPGNVLKEFTDTIGIASNQDEGNAIADLNTYAAPVAGVSGDMHAYEVDSQVRFIYPLPGDEIRVKNSGVSFAADDTVDISNGEAIVGTGVLVPYGLVLETTETTDTHVLIRVL